MLVGCTSGVLCHPSVVSCPCLPKSPVNSWSFWPPVKGTSHCGGLQARVGKSQKGTKSLSLTPPLTSVVGLEGVVGQRAEALAHELGVELFRLVTALETPFLSLSASFQHTASQELIHT